MEIDEETRDRDREKKEKEREYADGKRRACESEVEIGNSVLVKRNIKANKLSSNFEPTVHKVIDRNGTEAVVEAEETGKRYRRNVAHLKKIIIDSEPANQHTEAIKPPTNSSPINDEPISRRTRQRPAHLKDFVRLNITSSNTDQK